jgi:hypothetical protein
MNTVTSIRNAKISAWIAELYLIIAVLGYWGLAKAFVNPVAIGMLAILLLLIWRKIALLGWIIGMVFLLLNLYMVAALNGELAEFTEFNSRALELLVGGILFLGCNILASILLLVKWGRRIG